MLSVCSDIPHTTATTTCSDMMSALLVSPKDAKRIRAVAEAHGVFDATRRIGPYEGIHAEQQQGQERGGGVLAVPVTACTTAATLPSDLQHLRLVDDANLRPSASAQSRKQTPHHAVTEALRLLLGTSGVEQQRVGDLLTHVPRRWEEHGDLLLFPAGSFAQPEWQQLGDELWKAITGAVPRFTRVAIQHAVDPNPMRTSRATLVFGDSPIVTHVDNGVRYTYDITKLMFSRGNITEKLRVASFPCKGEVVVDLFAGIGYFTLPYLVHAGAAKLYACEWNPNAVAMLKQNLQDNKVADRCEVFEGDNRTFPLANIADRVNLGLIPTSKASWPVAVRVLRQDTGGWLHIHENVEYDKETEQKQAHELFAAHVARDIKSLLEARDVSTSLPPMPSSSAATTTPTTAQATPAPSEEIAAAPSSLSSWEVHVRHIECVKSYAPRVDHVVFDVECRPCHS